MVFLGVATLGVSPLAIWLSRRRWPRHLDENGMTLASGKFISWNEFTRVRKVRVLGQGGAVLAERYDLRSSAGKASVVTTHLHDGEAVAAYVWEHLPEEVCAEAIARD
jgi:hypothetical protein